ncbi:MAG: TraR/DksA C4-type zinc finger protein [Myxococcales bacterium]|nr:TraR/DksA C4-type zinc finger protein [Myxococcales bacterium]MCA9771902.1 TraR/DksA C4-type zinc finger protein [Myxococcales bacterium]MCB9549885.1 TraR/DksA C4-type zinc finger protein [Myxococcales bacterium]
MDQKDLEYFRLLLLARREALMDAPPPVEPLRDAPTDKVDEDLQPLAEMNQMIASNRNKARLGSIRLIEEAIERIDEEPDEYGLCLSCEEPIMRRRLELMPWVTLCVDCQSRQEQAQANRAAGGRRHITDYED